MELKLKLKNFPGSRFHTATAQVVVEKPKPGVNEAPTSFKEVYPLIEPYAYAAITHDPKTGGMLYYVIEPTLSEED